METEQDLSKLIDRICMRKLGTASKFKDYDADALVFFSIGGKHGYEQKRPNGTRQIIPGEVYPDSGLNAKMFELELAYQATGILDMTPDHGHIKFGIAKALQEWEFWK